MNNIGCGLRDLQQPRKSSNGSIESKKSCSIAQHYFCQIKICLSRFIDLFHQRGNIWKEILVQRESYVEFFFVVDVKTLSVEELFWSCEFIWNGRRTN